MHFVNDNILTSVLLELRRNDLDSITVVCKGGELLRTSALLLAIVSPYLANILTSIQHEDTILLLPDVESKDLLSFLDWVLNTENHNSSSKFSDTEAYFVLDCILWHHKKCSQEIPLKSEEEFNSTCDKTTIIQDDEKETTDLPDPNVEEDDASLSDQVKFEVAGDDIQPSDPFHSDENEEKLLSEDIQIDHIKEEELIIEEDFKSCNDDNEPLEAVNNNDDPTESNNHVEKPSSPEAKKIKSNTKDYLATRRAYVAKVAKRFQCYVCGKYFPFQVKLKRHMLTHSTEKPYFCDICQKFFKSEEGYDNHMRSHSDERFKFPCQYCEKSYAIKNLLVVHEATHTKVNNFFCDVCGKGLRTKGNLRIHMKTHLDKSDIKQIPCDQCGKCFTDKLYLKRHMNRHSKEKPISCELCGKLFKTKDNYAFHMKLHTGDLKHQCKFCEKKFAAKLSMLIHETTHTGVKLYNCEECGQGFNTKRVYETHQLRHQGYKPIYCKWCKYCYKDQAEFDDHMKKKHSDPAALARKFPCDICKKVLETRSSYKCHMQVQHGAESKYKCSTCDKAFPHKSALLEHQTIHTGIKLFYCDECDRGFNKRKRLSNHKLIQHKGIKPFYCRPCHSYYGLQSEYDTHLAKIHGGVKPVSVKKLEEENESDEET